MTPPKTPDIAEVYSQLRRIKNIRPVIPPALLLEDFPVSGTAADTVRAGRRGAGR